MHSRTFWPSGFIDEVLEKYSNMVFRIAYSQTKNKADAEDVFQEVFVRLMSANKDFESDEHLRAWLIRVTVNRSKSLLTSAWFRRTTAFSEDESACMKEVSEVLDVVRMLPAKYRIVIHLHYYEDMQISEISRVLGKNENTIKSQLHRAREILKQKLKGEFDNV